MNRNKLVVVSLFLFTVLGCFLQGCSEGVDKSPFSALSPNMIQENYSSIKETDAIHNSTLTNEEILSNNMNVIDSGNTIKTLTIKVISAYTGSPLEYATVKINNENLGITDSKGELMVSYLPIGISNIEISKKDYETLVFETNLDKNNSNKTLVITMVEINDDDCGSITGKYCDLNSFKGIGNLYVRLYKINEKLSSENLPNSNCVLEKDFIITTKTSTNSTLEGTFKLTNLESGIYQLYIGKTNDIPEIVKINNNQKLVRLNSETKGQLVLTEPFKVEKNKTIFWSNSK